MSLPRLTYFSTRGRAELIRLVLAEAGVEHEEINVGEYSPTSKTAEFLALQSSGQLVFDALPMWEEDGLSMVQSDAIVRHIARTHGLEGTSTAEAALCDMILGGVNDVTAEVGKLRALEPARRSEFRASLADQILPRWLGYFERLLARSQRSAGFFVGTTVTYADLAVLLMLERLSDNGLAGALAQCPRLAAFSEQMSSRPRVAAYLASPKRWPVQLLPA